MKRSAILILALASALPAHAEPSANDQLKETQSAIARADQRHHEILAQSSHLKEELAEVQRQLVHGAAAEQEKERELTDDEEKLGILEHQQAEKNAALVKQKAALATMISAAVRLSQTPPEAALFMPGDLGDTLKAARVLATLTDSIRRESESLNAQLKELASLMDRVRIDRARVDHEEQELKARQQELQARLGQRKALLKQLSGEEGEVRRRLAELNKRAGSLKELIAGLEKQRRESEARHTAEAKLHGPAPEQGKMHPPVAGRVIRVFGQRVNANETSKGVLFAARPGAEVVAPYDGEVVFTGPFLDYGKMVILRHRGDFHTLLAGLQRIDVTVGQFLLEGEPIGVMGENSSRDLYVELRQHNQPVNPAEWIAGL